MKKGLLLGISLVVLVMVGLVLAVNYFDNEDLGMGVIEDIGEEVDMVLIEDIDEDSDIDPIAHNNLNDNNLNDNNLNDNEDLNQDKKNLKNIPSVAGKNKGGFTNNLAGGFVNIINSFKNRFHKAFKLLFGAGGIKKVGACSSRSDCIAGGFVDPAPYCDANFRVMPRVFCFNRGMKTAYCGIHNMGMNRRECNPGFFCNEIDIDNNGIIDNVVCSKGVNCNDNGICEYGEDMEKCVDCNPFDPKPPKPPGIPDPGPPFLPAPGPGPGPAPPDFSCERSKDCSLPPTEDEVSCEDRDGDGVDDELVRKRACCLGIGSNKQCNVCDRVSNCRYGCGWREDMNPPKIFCCPKNDPCNEPGCDGDGICEDGEIPGICSDCPICNHDGVCDVGRGENAHNCIPDCIIGPIECCTNEDCGPKTYECGGNTVIWRFPQCKKMCTPDSECKEGYIKSDCSKLGKVCEIGSDGKSRCVSSGSSPSNVLSD